MTTVSARDAELAAMPLWVGTDVDELGSWVLGAGSDVERTLLGLGWQVVPLKTAPFRSPPSR